jgi:hypothetical protein
LLDGIDVHWTEKDKDYFRTKTLNIGELNVDFEKPDAHISRSNQNVFKWR